MKTCKCSFVLIAVLAVMACFFTASVQAHDTWVTPSVFKAVKGTAPDYTVSNSHHFPASAEDAMAPDRLDKLFVVGPDGKEVAGTASLSKAGTYVAVAVPVNGFATKTPEGYQRGKNKTQVDNPILCSKSMKFAKSIFTVGAAGGDAWGKSLGHAMEIIPLKDPAALKAGDILEVKVLLDGKPARTFVFGTYDGFSPEANTFGYTTRTDKKGVARIKLIHNGSWLLIAKVEEPFADPEICDAQRWAATLTFNVN